MDTIEIYLGLGTNEGDRQANIDHALAALTQTGIEHFYLNGATPIRKRQEMVADLRVSDVCTMTDQA